VCDPILKITKARKGWWRDLKGKEGMKQHGLNGRVPAYKCESLSSKLQYCQKTKQSKTKQNKKTPSILT
jgi:hypothetical protein